MLIDSWRGAIDGEGGKAADIKIDDYLRKFSGEVISRACFGSDYGEGEQIFHKLRALQQLTAKKGLFIGIPGMSYVPTKQKRREWKVQRDVRELILRLVKQKSEATNYLEKNMLQMILAGAETNNLSSDVVDKFTVDNCKNIYLAGYETTAITASWCLMLLASNPLPTRGGSWSLQGTSSSSF
ncbi:hypothetical protein C2S51_004068 [Perilla frutescens var. frutescens]|nr:hypothetical protein C2S51_004068 [Perilla frutescens var. frutescens]